MTIKLKELSQIVPNDDVQLVAINEQETVLKTVWCSQMATADELEAVKIKAEQGLDELEAVKIKAEQDLNNHTHSVGDFGIGVGQSWHNELASKVKNVTYINNTGRSILVSVSFLFNNAQTFNFKINNNVVATAYNSDNANGSNVSVIIPSGDIYRVEGSGSVVGWSELR